MSVTKNISEKKTPNALLYVKTHQCPKDYFKIIISIYSDLLLLLLPTLDDAKKKKFYIKTSVLQAMLEHRNKRIKLFSNTSSFRVSHQTGTNWTHNFEALPSVYLSEIGHRKWITR